MQPIADGFAKEVGHAGVDRIDRALRDLANPQDAMARVQQDDYQTFVAGVAEVAGEDACGVGGAFDGGALVRPLRSVGGAASSSAALTLGGLGQADAMDAGEFVDGGVRASPAKGNEFGQQRLPEFKRAALR